MVSGVLDAIFLTGEERRAFISYAHVDGFPVATELYRMLSLQQFDVYLDRYRTNPAVDFVERIEDELRDKAMLVVVETRGAAASSWVGTEVLAARSRGYGLLGVFLTDVAASARHPWIPQSCRIELDSTAPDAAEVLLQSVVDTYRRCVVSQRVQRRDGIRLALRTAVRDAAMAGRLAQPYPSIVEHGDEMEFVVSGARYRVLGSFRPGGVRKAREVAGRSTDDTVPVVFSPTPGRRERTHDVMWLDDETPVTFVADGWMTVAARQMLRADL